MKAVDIPWNPVSLWKLRKAPLPRFEQVTRSSGSPLRPVSVSLHPDGFIDEST